MLTNSHETHQSLNNEPLPSNESSMIGKAKSLLMQGKNAVAAALAAVTLAQAPIEAQTPIQAQTPPLAALTPPQSTQGSDSRGNALAWLIRQASKGTADATDDTQDAMRKQYDDILGDIKKDGLLSDTNATKLEVLAANVMSATGVTGPNGNPLTNQELENMVKMAVKRVGGVVSVTPPAPEQRETDKTKFPEPPDGANLLGNGKWPAKDLDGLVLAQSKGGLIEVLSKKEGYGIKVQASPASGGSNYLRIQVPEVREGREYDFTVLIGEIGPFTELVLVTAAVDKNGDPLTESRDLKTIPAGSSLQTLKIRVPKEVSIRDPRKPQKTIEVKPEGMILDIVVNHAPGSANNLSPMTLIRGLHLTRSKQTTVAGN